MMSHCSQASAKRCATLENEKKNQARCCMPNFAFRMFFLLLLIFKHGRSLFDQLWLFQKAVITFIPSFFINFCLEAPSAGGTLSHPALHSSVGTGSDSIPCHLSTPAQTGQRKSSEEQQSASGCPDCNSSLNHQNPPKLVLVFHIF